MPSYKILVPLDGSRVAEQSLVYLSALKKLGEVEVFLTSIADIGPDTGALSHKETVDREYNLLATYLREVGTNLRDHLGISVETSVSYGPAAACILNDADHFGADLIVISTHGRSGVSRWRLGSVADKVIRSAECATLVVGPRDVEKAKWLEADLEPPFKSILVPLDGSELAEQALPLAKRYSECFDSEVHLVQVITLPVLGDSLGMAGAYTPDFLTAMEDGARDYLAEVKTRFDASTKIRTAVLIGTPAGELVDYAKHKAIELVIVTTHGRGGFVRAALGSVTDRLIGGESPVLVVRPKTD
ncbi:MAG TPA: universal stress protein [Dehalococcoidia bacterium]|nr:universal stress protein [Dehalococcoidia bacterium]